jgi:hypothetical protein
LLLDGIRKREEPLYIRLGFSNPLRAQLEDEREVGQDPAEFLEEVAEDGLEARRTDALDAIGASDELRARVESVRKEDESLEAVLRRLIRVGAERSTESADRRERALWWAEASVASFLIFALALNLAGPLLQYTFPMIGVSVQDLFAAELMVVIVIYLVQRARWLAIRG